jgi:hypothetical protein
MSDNRSLTIEEWQQLSSRMRSYYKKNHPDKILNIPQEHLKMKPGRKYKFISDEEKRQKNNEYVRKHRLKKNNDLNLPF